MKLAKSIYYGGQLIDAADCDYDSYKELGLRCGNCGEAVFWQGEYQRHVADSLVTIRPQFKHFRHKDPALVKICESRVAQYDQREVERYAAKARNQRLKFFQRHFWQTFTNYYEGDTRFSFNRILEEAKEDLFCLKTTKLMVFGFEVGQGQEVLNEVVFNMLNLLLVDKKFVKIVPHDNKEDIGYIPIKDLQDDFIDKFSTKLHYDLHLQICSEIISFLKTRSAKPILENLYCCSVMLVLAHMLNGEKLGFKGQHLEEVLRIASLEDKSQIGTLWSASKNVKLIYHYSTHQLLLWLTMLPWANRLNSLSESK